MKPFKVQRVRDPVHGLIVFAADGDDALRDQAAWKIINTPEFQRLRRIRQLGVSEFTFPGATHSRFSHSIGVFHTARRLVGVIQKLQGATFHRHKANVAVLAALMHDLGHGPFSHAFESVQKARKAAKKHEIWTADIIQNPDGKIREILEEFTKGITEQIAELLASENPTDEYHAVVSSSFDADRLDYLRRDRLMTGSGAGAIDYDWLVDNIRIAEVSLAGDDEEDGPTITTFCLDQKALQAAESFLLARYHLFEQVYLHKTTRGIETLIRKLLTIVADAAHESKAIKELGLDRDDPLIRFFGPRGETIPNYLALDDNAVWTAIARIANGKNEKAASLASRLRDRRLLKALDVGLEFPVMPGELPDQTEERRQREIVKIEERFGSALHDTIFKDAEKLDLYGEIGADEAKRHKKLSIQLRDKTTREITQLSPTIKTLSVRKNFVRYYGEIESSLRRGLKGEKDGA
jgi:HD superfamily phosphohydrolase